MKILLSAFSFGPGAGSEPGIGWNWAVHAAKLGHRVHVIAGSEYRKEIEVVIASGDLPKGLTIEVFMPSFIERICERGLGRGIDGLVWNIAHLLWQRALVPHVRTHHLHKDFDIAHHITLGGFRHPTLLYKTGLPLVVGPIGGGDRAPFRLRRNFPWKGWIADLVRDAYNTVMSFEPTTRQACSKSLAYYARTKATRDLLPKSLRDKIRVRLELGINPEKIRTQPAAKASALPKETDPKASGNAPVRILYAGQLLYLKGMGLGLQAFAQTLKEHPNTKLTMVGSGPEEAQWRRLAKELDIDKQVTWRGWVNYTDMPKVYAEHDIFLFPSLRDSSGNVVVEALSQGLPVVCLELGGPNEMVTEDCGRIASVAGASEDEVVHRLAAKLSEIVGDDDLRRRLSKGALRRTEDFLWPNVVQAVYDEVAQDLEALRQRKESAQKTSIQEGGALKVA